MNFDLKEENLAFVAAKLSIEDLKCVFCKELPTDPRVTRCCSKYVCFECWKKKVKDFDYDDEYYDLWDYIYCCRICSFNFGEGTYVHEKYFTDLCVPRPQTIYMKKLYAVVVKCPDKDCKKEMPFATRDKHWENDCDRLVTCKECATVTKVSDKHVCSNILKEKILEVREQLDDMKIEPEYDSSDYSDF